MKVYENAMIETACREWCAQHNALLTIRNNGHHWQFRRGMTFVDWWPSTGKMDRNGQQKPFVCGKSSAAAIGWLTSEFKKQEKLNETR